MRLILITLNTVVALGAGLDFVVADLELTVFDLIGLAIASVMVMPLPGRAEHNLRELAHRELVLGAERQSGAELRRAGTSAARL